MWSFLDAKQAMDMLTDGADWVQDQCTTNSHLLKPVGATSLVFSSASSLGTLFSFILFCRRSTHGETKAVDLGRPSDPEVKRAQLPCQGDTFPTALRTCKTSTHMDVDVQEIQLGQLSSRELVGKRASWLPSAGVDPGTQIYPHSSSKDILGLAGRWEIKPPMLLNAISETAN